MHMLWGAGSYPVKTRGDQSPAGSAPLWGAPLAQAPSRPPGAASAATGCRAGAEAAGPRSPQPLRAQPGHTWGSGRYSAREALAAVGGSSSSSSHGALHDTNFAGSIRGRSGASPHLEHRVACRVVLGAVRERDGAGGELVDSHRPGVDVRGRARGLLEWKRTERD